MFSLDSNLIQELNFPLLHIRHCVVAIGLVAMLYDHALTIDDEVQLVWHARPSFAKYAFLYNRYSAVAVLTAVQYCACPFVFEVLKLILVYPPFLLDEKSPERRQSQCQWLGPRIWYVPA